jgi:D-3-phosphoglycerate dehydrogenase
MGGSARSASATDRSRWTRASWRAIPVFNAPYSNTRSVGRAGHRRDAIMLMRGIRRRARSATAAAGPSRPRAATRRAARPWASSATATRHPGRRAGRRHRACTSIFHDIETKLSLGNARSAAGLATF